MEIIDKREAVKFSDVKRGQVFSTSFSTSEGNAVWLKMRYDEAVDLRDGEAGDFRPDDGCFVLIATLTIR